MSFQRDVLSPNQWPAFFPLDGKVDLVITTPLFPVAIFSPLLIQQQFLIRILSNLNFGQIFTRKLGQFDSIQIDYVLRNEGIRYFALDVPPYK